MADYAASANDISVRARGGDVAEEGPSRVLRI